jgi:hypothetical protein
MSSNKNNGPLPAAAPLGRDIRVWSGRRYSRSSVLPSEDASFGQCPTRRLPSVSQTSASTLVKPCANASTKGRPLSISLWACAAGSGPPQSPWRRASHPSPICAGPRSPRIAIVYKVDTAQHRIRDHQTPMRPPSSAWPAPVDEVARAPLEPRSGHWSPRREVACRKAHTHKRTPPAPDRKADHERRSQPFASTHPTGGTPTWQTKQPRQKHLAEVPSRPADPPDGIRTHTTTTALPTSRPVIVI